MLSLILQHALPVMLNLVWCSIQVMVPAPVSEDSTSIVLKLSNATLALPYTATSATLLTQLVALLALPELVEMLLPIPVPAQSDTIQLELPAQSALLPAKLAQHQLALVSPVSMLTSETSTETASVLMDISITKKLTVLSALLHAPPAHPLLPAQLA